MFRFVIHADKTIAEGGEQSAVRLKKVHFLVSAEPGVVEVGRSAAPGVVKSGHERNIVIAIRVEASQITIFVVQTQQAVNTGMIIWPAAEETCVVGATRRVDQRAKIIIEGVIFLHDDNHMLDLLQVTVGPCWNLSHTSHNEQQQKSGSNKLEQSHQWSP